MQSYSPLVALVVSIFALLATGSVLAAEAPTVTCEWVLANPIDKPIAERIAKAYETLLRGNGLTPALLPQYGTSLSELFRFKDAATPEQAVLQDGLQKLKEAIEARIKSGEITENNVRKTLGEVLRRMTGENKSENREQRRVDKEREAPPELWRGVPLTAKAQDQVSVLGITAFGNYRPLYAVSSDGEFFAFTVDSESSAKLFVVSLKTGKLLVSQDIVPKAEREHNDIARLAFSPDSRYLLTFSAWSLSVWDTTTWERWRRTLPTCLPNDPRVAFSPDHKRFYFVSGFRSVLGFDFTSKKEVFALEPGLSIRDIAVTPDGSGLAALIASDRGVENEVNIYGVDTRARTYASGKFRLSDRAEKIFFGASGEVLLDNIDGSQPVSLGAHLTAVLELTKPKPKKLDERNVRDNFASPSRRYHVSRDKGEVAMLWDSKQMKFIPLEATPRWQNRWKLFFSADESALIGVTFPMVAHVWDLPSGSYRGARDLKVEDRRKLLGASRAEAFFLSNDGSVHSLNLYALSLP